MHGWLYPTKSTRIKEKPSARDLGNINAVITELMSNNDISPTGEPFPYMCISIGERMEKTRRCGRWGLGRVTTRNGEGYMKRKLRILEIKYLSQSRSSCAWKRIKKLQRNGRGIVWCSERSLRVIFVSALIILCGEDEVSTEKAEALVVQKEEEGRSEIT